MTQDSGYFESLCSLKNVSLLLSQSKVTLLDAARECDSIEATLAAFDLSSTNSNEIEINNLLKNLLVTFRTSGVWVGAPPSLFCVVGNTIELDSNNELQTGVQICTALRQFVCQKHCSVSNSSGPSEETLLDNFSGLNQTWFIVVSVLICVAILVTAIACLCWCLKVTRNRLRNRVMLNMKIEHKKVNPEIRGSKRISFRSRLAQANKKKPSAVAFQLNRSSESFGGRGTLEYQKKRTSSSFEVSPPPSLSKRFHTPPTSSFPRKKVKLTTGSVSKTSSKPSKRESWLFHESDIEGLV